MSEKWDRSRWLWRDWCRGCGTALRIDETRCPACVAKDGAMPSRPAGREVLPPALSVAPSEDPGAGVEPTPAGPGPAVTASYTIPERIAGPGLEPGT